MWADGRPFLAMKLIRGRTLDELLKANAAVDTLAVFEGVCHAIGYAHAHGVIHRDLKPANVMVGAFGEVQVMDWGLAKLLATPVHEGDEGGDTTIDMPGTRTFIRGPRRDAQEATLQGSVMGTPAYMAPEQAAGKTDQIDRRADVFGLGAVLCALLTGRAPFGGSNAEGVRKNAAAGNTAEALARLDASGADSGVVALCKRCLSADPADRPADAGVVATAVADLRRAADERARQAERDKLAAQVREGEQRKRRRAVQWAAAAVAGVVFLGVGGPPAGMVRADEQRQEAEQAKQKEATARNEAEANLATAEAVLKFIEKRVFAAARPVGAVDGQGKQVTVHAAGEAALPHLTTDLAGQPRAEGRVRAALAEMFYFHNDPKRSVEQYVVARDLLTSHLGRDHPDTLAVDLGLGEVYSEAGRPADALPLFEEAHAGFLAHAGPDGYDTLFAEMRRASALTDLGRGREALPLLDDCLARCRRTDYDWVWLAGCACRTKLYHFRTTGDAAECRRTAERWEGVMTEVPYFYLHAAEYRAITAGVYAAANNPAAATAEGDRAMAWLHKAMAAGDRNGRAIFPSEITDDDDLAPLRARDDFKKLLADLQK